jgi:hypothetical protein
MRQGQTPLEFLYVQAIVGEGLGQTGDDLFAFGDEGSRSKGFARTISHGRHNSAQRVWPR